MNHFYKSFTTSRSVYNAEEQTAQESTTAFFKKLRLIAFLFLLLPSTMSWGQTFSIVGTGTSSSSSGSSTSSTPHGPYGNYYWGVKNQYFVTAAQLTAAGISSNSGISSLGFNVVADHSTATTVLTNFTIRVYTTTSTNPISSSYLTSTLVAQTAPTNYNPAVGWNQHTFTSSFVWNGTDNLVIETCFNNSGWSSNATVQTTTSGLGTGTWNRWIRGDNATICSSTSSTSTSTSTRPNMRFGWTAASACSGTPTPGTIASNTSQNVCSGSTPAALTVTGTTSGVTGISFQWEQSTDNASWTNASDGTGATTASYTPPSFGGTTIYYRCKVTCTNSSIFDVTNTATIDPPANPSTQVSSLAFSSVSYTGFTATWTNGNGNRRVVYISDTAITDPTNNSGAAALTANTTYSGSGQQIVYDGTGTSVAITGLTLTTTYYVKVIEYTRCGSGPYDNYFNVSSGTNSSTVTTTSASTVPWSESFAVGATLTNWLASADFFVSSSITALNPAISSNYAYVNLDGYPSTASLITPVIGSIPSNYRFVVKYKLANYTSPYSSPASGSGNFIVAVSTNNGTSYTDVVTVANNTLSGWQEYVLNLSAYAGQNIRIRLTGNYISGDYYLAFDDFSVEAIPSCSSPTSLTISSITNNSASLSWTAPESAPASGYDVYYSTTNSAPTSGTTASASVSSGTTYAFSDLTANTTYYSWVRSNCGSSDVSAWASSASFTTQCDPVSVPYSQDFESVTTPAIPICTSIENAGTGNNWKTASPGLYGFTTKCLNYTYNSYNAANAWFFTAGINLTAGTSYRISYNYGSSSTTYFPENLKVAYGVSASSTSMTTVLATHTNILTNSAPSSTVDFTPSTTGIYYFGFNAFSDTDMDNLYVDNISIILAPNTWTGTTSSSWNTAGNWSLNTVPTTSDNIVISSGTNAPVLDVDLTIPVGKSLTLSGTGTLTIASGKTLTVAGTVDFGGKSVILKSDNSGTAALAQITGTLTGATNVTVERYIPAKRGWRLLTAPLKGSSSNTVGANWQGTANEGLLLFSPATYQTQTMTGYTTGGSSPNIWKYDSANTQWQSIPAISTENLFSSTVNNGFLVFATGPHGSNTIASSTTAEATTLKPKGQLITGSVTHTLTANKYHLLGNPYASPINTQTMVQANAGSTIYMVDPTLGTYGGYFIFDGSNWTPSTPTESNMYIQSGQGFFLKSTAGGTFTIAESHKASGNSNTWFERTTTDTSTDKIRVLLYKQINTTWQLADGILAVNSASGNHDLDAIDVGKMNNFNENLLFKNGASNLAIEYRGLPAAGTLQPLQLTGTSAQGYELRIKTENYSNSNLTPYLENTQTGALTPIPTDGSEVIVPFTGIAATSAAPDSRFRIVYQAPLSADDMNNLVVGVYPNPVQEGLFTIELANTNAPASYTLTNLLGQEVQKGTLMSLTNAIAVQDLSQGVYLLQINQESKRFTTKLMIK
jgi:hypothetical protein